MKPSTFKRHPFGSVSQNCEAEIVAANIMRILARTGDTFRPLTVEEYTKERKKDGNFTTAEINLFHKVQKWCKSADAAVVYSPTWEQSAVKIERKT